MAAANNPSIPGELEQLSSAENAGPIERLADLLQEADRGHHGRPAAQWARWYAAFVNERQRGASFEGAQAFADKYTVGQPT